MDRLSVLGQSARAARRAGLGRLVDSARDAMDNACARRTWLPLSYSNSEVDLRGLMRHRSFLDELRSGYEQYTRELLRAALTPGAIVIDGGAHIGYFAQLAARFEPRIARLIAFEPDPYNFVALRSNLERLDLSRVEARHAALADRTGTAMFHVSSGTISSSLFRRTGVRTTWRAAPVAVTTVDSELREFPEPRVIVAKLDIEGAEPLALRGMRRTIERASSATLVVEANQEALRDSGYSPTELKQVIRELGLSVAFIDEAGHALRPVEDPWRLGKGNLYCVKSSPV
jgi:FkbM family methyltransferase